MATLTQAYTVPRAASPLLSPGKDAGEESIEVRLQAFREGMGEFKGRTCLLFESCQQLRPEALYDLFTPSEKTAALKESLEGQWGSLAAATERLANDKLTALKDSLKREFDDIVQTYTVASHYVVLLKPLDVFEARINEAEGCFADLRNNPFATDSTWRNETIAKIENTVNTFWAHLRAVAEFAETNRLVYSQAQSLRLEEVKRRLSAITEELKKEDSSRESEDWKCTNFYEYYELEKLVSSFPESVTTDVFARAGKDVNATLVEIRRVLLSMPEPFRVMVQAKVDSRESKASLIGEVKAYRDTILEYVDRYPEYKPRAKTVWVDRAAAGGAGAR